MIDTTQASLINQTLHDNVTILQGIALADHADVRATSIDVITAERLDQNKTYLSNITPEVIARDGVWSEQINSGEYARVEFERALNSHNDITIVARSLGQSTIDVYEKGNTTLITTFKTITTECWYQIFLTNLTDSQPTFDLKTCGDPVEYDYIVDPTTGWVSPTGYADPSSQWTTETNAYDDNVGTYAAHTGAVGWQGYLQLNVSSAIYCDRVRLYADFDTYYVDKVSLSIFNSTSWIEKYNGTITDGAWTELEFAGETNVTKARFRYHYIRGSVIFWFYEFDFWRGKPHTLPNGTTLAATSIDQTTAVLKGNVTDDGGEPCQFRFQYGLTTSYGTSTSWGGSEPAGVEFGTMIHNLTLGNTYQYRVQILNDMGMRNGSNKNFTTALPSLGWISPTSHYDPTSKWTNKVNSYDDETDTCAQSNHAMNTPQWGSFIYLNHSVLLSDMIRFYARGPTADPAKVDQVDLDVQRGGVWYDLLNATFTDKQWVQVKFTQGSVTSARVRFHVNSANSGLYYELYELDFNNSRPVPMLINEGPTNRSWGVARRPQMNITVSNPDGAPMTITWSSNSSGSWQVFGTNSSVGNGTYHQLNNNFSSNNTKYWWKVLVTDGIDSNSSWYYFSTPDYLKPSSSVVAISPYWKKSAATITATASDTGWSGVKNVTLYYRFSVDNATWGGWVSTGVDPAAPWSWSFSFTNSTGYYQFYSIAIDNATNTELPPGSADARCGYETILPSSSVDTITPYLISNRGTLVKKSETASYGATVRALVNDTTYVYAAGQGTNKVYQYWKSNMTKKAETVSYGGSINALAQDTTYLYAGGLTTNKVYQYWKSNLTKKAEGNFGATIYAITLDATYVYAAGEAITGNYKVYQYWISNLTKRTETAGSYGGPLYTLAQDTTYLYAGGATTQKMYQYWKTNLTKRTEIASYGGDIQCSAVDTTYLFVGGATTQKIYEYWKTNLTKKAETASYGGTIQSLVVETTYMYVGGTTTNKVYQYWKSNLTKRTESTSYQGVWSLVTDSTYVYAGGDTTNKVYQYYKYPFTTITATASDIISGVKNVTLYYRFTATNASWGNWVNAGVDTAAPWSWNFNLTNGSGFYQFYSIAKDNATNVESAPGSPDALCGYDGAAPTSSVSAVVTYWKTTQPQTLTVTASDIGTGGLRNVTVYYYNSTNNNTWKGPWKFGATNTTPWVTPMRWRFSFPNGTGFYRFYSVAYDNASNKESFTGNDTMCGYDITAPSSSVNIILPHWRNTTPVTIGAIANDAGSGVKNVTLYYRFSGNNQSWGGYVKVGVVVAPWSWSVPLSNGTGYYQFYSIAKDNVSNTESAPGSADASCGYETVAPTSSVNVISPYWQRLSVLSITASANDAMSGVKNVTLWYRFSGNNASWGDWVNAGVHTIAPWSWSFSFSNGSGYYQFYSIAKDNAGNTESSPGNADAQCGWDNGKPSSNLSMMPSFRVYSSPRALNATASDTLSGVKNVTLFYSYSTDNTTWGTNWYNTSWMFRKKLTIDHTKVAGNLTNFPVLVSITDTNLSTKAQSTANDIVFTTSAGVKLNHEIESYNSTTGTLVAWVNVTSISTTTDVVLYMYYGNPSASNQQNRTGTWDGNYQAVWHLGESTNPYHDSTSHKVNSTSGTYPTQTTGQIGNAQNFVKANSQNINFSNGAVSYPMNMGTNDWTVSAWIKTSTSVECIVSKGSGAPGPLDNWQFRITSNLTGIVFMMTKQGVGSLNTAQDGTVVGDNVWHYVTVRVVRADKIYRYVDGSHTGTDLSCVALNGQNINGSQAGMIGARDLPGNANFFNGVIDEVRCSKIARSATWIATEYNNQKNPNTFLAFGAEQPYIEWIAASNPDISSPWSWSFNFPNSTGYYRFYSIANDIAGNKEDSPKTPDALCHYINDTTKPTSTLIGITPYWQKSSPLTLTLSVTDSGGSGLKNATLYYYNSTTNTTWRGPWRFGTNTTPWVSPVRWSFTFPNGTGYYRLYSVAYDNASNKEMFTGNDTTCGYDPTAPMSSADAMSPYWKKAATSLTATAGDASSGVKNVTLWYRFSGDNASWEGWMNGGVDTASPWSWNFSYPNGTGRYQFYSIAKDNATNVEIAPGSADAQCGYDNLLPSSSINGLTPYWVNTGRTLTAAAGDSMSGVRNVTLYYRFSSTNVSWGGWVNGGVDSLSPWSWVFSFPNGTGYYQFYSIAKDNATNTETPPGSADAVCGYDDVAPSSSVDTISPYWGNVASTIVSATATNDKSGMKNVTLWYRFSSDNASWDAWMNGGVDTTAPWSWVFPFTNGTGYYQFYSIAKDNATNSESVPGSADASCGYDTVTPMSSVTSLAPFWRKTSPAVVSATASDMSSGVKNVTLFYRFSSDNASWSGWVSAGVDGASPWSWSFGFSNGSGYYQLYSIAKDYATNAEVAPGAADASCGFDVTAPNSSVNAISPYWRQTTATISATASDTWSGVKNVTLFYRFSTTNASWGGWVNAGGDAAFPWSWSFTFPNGTGHYQFYSIAEDNATNMENVPGSADAISGYDSAPPTSAVNAISPYWKNAAATIVATANDPMSGVKNVTLYYRFSGDNASWDGWVSAEVDVTPPWSWSFGFTNGTGYYQFYSIAADNALSYELAPGSADAHCGYDTTIPVSSVNIISPYWKKTPISISATAGDTLSGVKNITLYYRFSVTNASWGRYVSVGTDTYPPWGWGFSFSNGTGYYQFYSIAKDNATNVEGAPGSWDAICGYDTVPPVSSVDGILPYWKNAVATVTAIVNDPLSGARNVSLFYRFSIDNASWGGWANAGVDTAAPWSWVFSFANGTGFYQFYSIARDVATNTESAPATANAVCGYETGVPSSSVNTLTPYWRNTGATITATANDNLSGVKNVSLWYHFSTNNATWGGWVSGGVDTTAPWSWSFAFSNGSGYYQFYSIAWDNATNMESSPGSADAWCGYENLVPMSSVDPIAGYWKTSSPLTITASASDPGMSGLKSVTLYYRYRPANASSWGSYVSFGVESLPWITCRWNFTFPNGSGHYEFYSIAVDNATNTEAAPGASGDEECGYSTGVPFSQVDAIAPFWTSQTSVGISAAADANGPSGLRNVTLYYYHSLDNVTWSGPWVFGTDDDPWVACWWNFTFPNRTGWYRFYSIAVDNSSSKESAPVINDTSCGFDDQAPTCMLSYNSSAIFFKSNDSLRINANFSERHSGINESSVLIRILTKGDGGLANHSMTMSDNTHWYYDWTVPGGSDDDGVFDVLIYTSDNVHNLLAPYPSVDSSREIDNTLPSITNVSADNISSSSAIIEWVTSEVASSTVEFGFTSAYGYGANTPGYITVHSMLLTGLSSYTTYHFRVVSYDRAGNRNISSDSMFVTRHEQSLIKTVNPGVPNSPPSPPTIDGPVKGRHATEYAYTAQSIDPDNDSINYTFDWGDKIVVSSGFIPSGTPSLKNHQWTYAGKYLLRVTASDNLSNAWSEELIWIDALPLEDLGYLLDRNSDGVYDTFHDNASGVETAVETKGGVYLIDANGNQRWDHEYNATTRVLSLKNENQFIEEGQPLFPWLWVIGMTVVLFLALMMIFFLRCFIHKANKK